MVRVSRIPNGNGDITVAANIVWNSANALTLSAYRDIDVAAPIAVSAAATSPSRLDHSGTGVGAVLNGGEAAPATGRTGIDTRRRPEAPTSYSFVTSPSLFLEFVDDITVTSAGARLGRTRGVSRNGFARFGPAWRGAHGDLRTRTIATSTNGAPVSIVDLPDPSGCLRRDEGNGWNRHFQLGGRLICGSRRRERSDPRLLCPPSAATRLQYARGSRLGADNRPASIMFQIACWPR